jgi:hypothetical protein
LSVQVERRSLPPLTAALATLACAAALLSMPTVRATSSCDALCTRVRGELRVFTGWLAEHDAQGFIGEVGWPGDEQWNALAQRWYADADDAGLPVTAWATGSWWSRDYPLATYGSTDRDGIDVANSQASVVEDHPTTDAFRRGINVAGAEFGAPATDAASAFSNGDGDTPDVDYHWEPKSTFTYLASRGVKVVRIPFRWERIQPTLRAKLDQDEVKRLKTTIANARDAGLEVIVDLHNYAGYYRESRDGRGIRVALGSGRLDRGAFKDVWRRLSTHLRNEPGVYAYGLMNEPVGMAQAGGLSGAQRWEVFSRAAVETIRANRDDKTILVGGYEWSGVQVWPEQHARPWIARSLGPVRYEAHHYWDRNNSGTYPNTYDDEVTDAQGSAFDGS